MSHSNSGMRVSSHNGDLRCYHSLESGFIMTYHKAPPIGSFKEEVENLKICFGRHNNVGSTHQYLGGTTQAYEKHLHYIISFISTVL